MNLSRVLLLAPAQKQEASKANTMMIVFLMMRYEIAEVVPEHYCWFRKASRTFSNSSRLPISTSLGLDPT